MFSILSGNLVHFAFPGGYGGKREKVGWKGKRKGEGEVEENLREQDGQDGERTDIRARQEIF